MLASCAAGGSSLCNHGTCDDSSFPIPVCVCEAGWTSTFCNVPVSNLSSVAFPSLFPNETTYYDDPFEDLHPVFNLSSVASIYINLPEVDYLYLIDPRNAFNETKKSASFFFHNEVMSAQMGSVGLSISGYSSRRSVWHNWNIKFDEFDKSQQLVEGVLEIGLKSGSEDSTMLRNALAMDLCRSMNLPVQRIGFTQLFINGRKHGFFVVYERITKEWLASRFPAPTSKKDVNLFKVFLFFSLFFLFSISSKRFRRLAAICDSKDRMRRLTNRITT